MAGYLVAPTQHLLIEAASGETRVYSDGDPIDLDPTEPRTQAWLAADMILEAPAE